MEALHESRQQEAKRFLKNNRDLICDDESERTLEKK
jgi:hypothetical protein